MNWLITSPQVTTMRGCPFLANGDRAVVQRVRNVHELYGFRFAEVTMTLPDYDDYELTATVCLDTLTTEAPALTHEQQEQLFNAVMEDYADFTVKTERIKKLKSDRYYNALQIKFSYAVTYPLALYCLHPRHREALSRELACGTKTINPDSCRDSLHKS